ncbi:hypothetical protein Gohar_004206 [Gossypium harknessii]|uniref:DUF4283 domain-containing protein n=1 Tax=Gossypium harknessii TaxID=34285 RepID=A0A7J9H5I3_9ROSI|nr:hypothetical protein [Gossypium harknessii]
MEEGLLMLSLTGREEEAWKVDLEEEVMRTNLVNLWHPHGGVTITDMGEKWFLFQVYYEIDLNMKLDIGISGIENIDSNKELGEEDCLMEIGEGKKRQRNSRAAGCNGNLMLECSGTGESPNRASPLAYVEGD